MSAEDLEKPLRPRTKPAPGKGGRIATLAVGGVAGAFVLFLVGYVLIVDDPFGGEPVAIVEVAPTIPAAPAAAAPGQPAEVPAGDRRTVRIVDGSTGRAQEVVVGSPAEPGAPSADRLTEPSRHGRIPRIGPDGLRPLEAHARPRDPASRTEGPRIALVLTGLGIGSSATSEAIARLPGSVTLAFVPYGADLPRWMGRARGDGHEILMQVPMEPFDFPNNDPGPQALLTSLPPEQNVDRLHWAMSRAGGYVGVANFMGARFQAHEASVGVVMREVAARGLIYFDDGSSQRSLTAEAAGAAGAAFARADMVIDGGTPSDIDVVLARLEATARDRGQAIGVASIAIGLDRLVAWIRALENRGITLVPLSAVVVRGKQS